MVNPQPVGKTCIFEEKMIVLAVMVLGIRLVQLTAFPVCAANILRHDAGRIKSSPALGWRIGMAMYYRIERGKQNEQRQNEIS